MTFDFDLLRYPFDDERWQTKLLIGGTLGIVGAFIWPLLLPLWGYAVRIMRRTIEEGKPSLPEWEEWGQLFEDGLRYLVVALVYTLPVIVLFCCALTFWLLIIPASAFAERAPALFAAAFGGQLLGFFLMGLALLPAVFLGYLAVVGVSRMAAYGAISAGLDFRAVWELARAGARHYVVAVIALLGLAYLYALVSTALAYTFVLICLLPLISGAASIYLLALFSALFGLAYREAAAELPPQTGMAAGG